MFLTTIFSDRQKIDPKLEMKILLNLAIILKQGSRPSVHVSSFCIFLSFVWSNYSDLTNRPGPPKGSVLEAKSPYFRKSRLVKYYNLGRFVHSILTSFYRRVSDAKFLSNIVSRTHNQTSIWIWTRGGKSHQAFNGPGPGIRQTWNNSAAFVFHFMRNDQMACCKSEHVNTAVIACC